MSNTFANDGVGFDNRRAWLLVDDNELSPGIPGTCRLSAPPYSIEVIIGFVRDVSEHLRTGCGPLGRIRPSLAWPYLVSRAQREAKINHN